jgi:ribosomal protein S18 acetylase RimI-like enzyme
MITYKKCTEVDLDNIYKAFQVGFSDYMIKLDVSQEMFIKRFFGPEGNELKYSFIALDEERPIGLILGGIKVYEGVKTLRCGTLCIHPDYRGDGISKALFALHKEAGVENGCKQLFLEVIVGNDRAIQFYKGLGYEKIYDLSYFSHSEPSAISPNLGTAYEIKEIDMETIESLQPYIEDIHINWQNDFDYIKKLEGVNHYGAYDDTSLIGTMSGQTNGKIYFLWIHPAHRSKGIGKALISHVANLSHPVELNISFPNNARLEGFLKHLGFKRDKISQYEMYLTL